MAELDLIELVPKDFMKIGCSSLEAITKTSFCPKIVDVYRDEINDYDRIELDSKLEALLEPIKLHPLREETKIFGIDTSNIELGETSEGILCAIRGTVVWRENRSYQYIRHGPFIFHITDMNKQDLYRMLYQVYPNMIELGEAATTDKMSESIRNIFERWLQRQICQSSEESLILLDGSLTTKAINNTTPILSEILSNAREKQSTVLAFAKQTTLSAYGHKVVDLIDNKYAPCISNIDEAAHQRYGNRFRFFGRVYAVKLMPSYFTFRLDIDRKIPEFEGIKAVQKLLGNDLIADNYPETLRLAHILSRFSSSEVLAMQRYVAENYNLKIISRPDVRQTLFGVYGGYAHKEWM